MYEDQSGEFAFGYWGLHNTVDFFPNIPTQDYTVGSLMQILILSLLYFKALLGRRNDKPTDRYSRLDKELENSNQSFITDQQQQQEVTTLS